MQRLHRLLHLTSQTPFNKQVPARKLLPCTANTEKAGWAFGDLGVYLLPFLIAEDYTPTHCCSTRVLSATALPGGQPLQASKHQCLGGKMGCGWKGRPGGRVPKAGGGCGGLRSAAPAWAVRAKGPVPQPLVQSERDAKLGLGLPWCETWAGSGTVRRENTNEISRREPAGQQQCSSAKQCYC